MATYSTELKTGIMQAIIDAIDGGAASGPGYLEIGSAAWAAVLATIPLASPCGDAPASPGGQLIFDFPVEDTSADNTGTAAIARIKNSDGDVIIDGLTVGTSNANVVLLSTTITSGQPVQLATGVVTHA